MGIDFRGREIACLAAAPGPLAYLDEALGPLDLLIRPNVTSLSSSEKMPTCNSLSSPQDGVDYPQAAGQPVPHGRIRQVLRQLRENVAKETQAAVKQLNKLHLLQFAILLTNYIIIISRFLNYFPRFRLNCFNTLHKDSHYLLD